MPALTFDQPRCLIPLAERPWAPVGRCRSVRAERVYVSTATHLQRARDSMGPTCRRTLRDAIAAFRVVAKASTPPAARPRADGIRAMINRSPGWPPGNLENLLVGRNTAPGRDEDISERAASVETWHRRRRDCLRSANGPAAGIRSPATTRPAAVDVRAPKCRMPLGGESSRTAGPEPSKLRTSRLTIGAMRHGSSPISAETASPIPRRSRPTIRVRRGAPRVKGSAHAVESRSGPRCRIEGAFFRCSQLHPACGEASSIGSITSNGPAAKRRAVDLRPSAA